MDETRIWSENELAVLEYVGTENERIEAGTLLLGEKRMLEALAQAERFLQARYPNETMSFSRVNHVLPNAQTYSFTVTTSADPEDSFSIKVTPGANADGTSEVVESRFNTVMKPMLQEIAEETMAQLHINAMCDLEIVGLYGAEFDPSKPLRELLASGLLLDVAGEIYVEEGEAPDTLVQQLGMLLREKNLCSGVTLVLVKDQCLANAAAQPLLENPYVVRTAAVRLPANPIVEVK